MESLAHTGFTSEPGREVNSKSMGASVERPCVLVVVVGRFGVVNIFSDIQHKFQGRQE